MRTHEYYLRIMLFVIGCLGLIETRGFELAAQTRDEKANAEAYQVVLRAFKAGNEALNAGRLDDAIGHYREGLMARADEPAVLTNLSEALRRRGAERYNAAIKDPNNETKRAGIDAARKDWSEAAARAQTALEVIKSTSPADANAQKSYDQYKAAAVSTRALAMRLVATKVDQTQAGAAWEAYQAYIAIEPNPTKKVKLRSEALQMLFEAGDLDAAVREGRKVLATEPNDPQANRVVGLALAASDDKSKNKEAMKHLQRYIDSAPATEPLKSEAEDVLKHLKESQKGAPSVAPGAGRKYLRDGRGCYYLDSGRKVYVDRSLCK
jgi:tetratricopeptide (TPR) repeat protein